MTKVMLEKIQKNFLVNEIALRVHFNWIHVILFSYFWMYGIFGFFTAPYYGILANIIITAFLTGGLIYLLYLKKKSVVYEDSFSFSYNDVSTLFLYVVIMGVLSMKEILIPMSGDNFYHSQQSQAYGIHLVQVVTRHTHIFDTFSFSFLIWLINIALVVGVLFLSYFIKKCNFWIQASILGVMFVILRTVLYVSGGNASPFPTLRLFPLWVTSTLFGLSDFSFRLASFIPLIILMFVVYYYSKEKLGMKVACILGFVSGTIPVIWHTGLLVESSIWTALLFTYFIFFLYQKEESIQRYVRPFAVIGTSTLLRVSGFVVLIPLFLHYLLSKRRTFSETILYIRYAVPIAVLILPIIIANGITGTSATYQGESYPSLGIRENAELITRLKILISDGYLYAIEYNSFHVPLLIILALLPIVIYRRKLVALPILLLTSICFLLFFSVRPILWGNGRYQAEYLAPLVIASFFYITLGFHRIVTLNGLKKKVPILLFLIGFIFYNIYTFKHIPEYNRKITGKSDYFENAKSKGDYFVLSEFPYDYRKALQTTQRERYATSTYYIPGNGYSYFAKILSGYSVNEMQYESMYREKVGFEFPPEMFSEVMDRIKNNKDVTIILINDRNFYPERIDDALLGAGFLRWKNFKEPVYGNIINSYIRK